MNIVYKDGTMVITHPSGIVTVYTLEEYEAYVKMKSTEVGNMQFDLANEIEILGFIEASKNGSTLTN